MSEQRAYKVFRIENGTVIDHIQSPLALKILDILKPEKNGIVSIGINFDSDTTGKKDIIKVENVYLSKEETDIIALLSPTATINIIKNGEVIEKRKLSMPEVVTSIMKCPNPTCITNKHSDCTTKFYIRNDDNKNNVAICHYCERETMLIPELMK